MSRRQTPRAMRGLIIVILSSLASARSASAGMYFAANVPELIASINTANQNAEPDFIELAAGGVFTLLEVNNSTNGPTGLPIIAASGELSIFGNGGVIERSAATETPTFRLFDVAAGAALRLQNLTLQGGHLYGSQVLTSEASAKGGAIFNQGDLALHNVTVQDNTAVGLIGYYARGYSAAGGGIYSSGSLAMQGGAIQNNLAQGGFGGHAFVGRDGASAGGPGGHGWGGGLYVAGGTATLNDVALSSNTVQGGAGGVGATYLSRGRRIATPGGRGGDGSGGGLFAAGGAVTLHNSVVTDNAATAGLGGRGGFGPPPGANGGAGMARGGGLYIEADSVTGLDELTSTHVTNNAPSNFYGPFELVPNLLPGDYNGDGAVDSDDLASWQGAFGITTAADADNDGDSDGADFLAWQRHYETGTPQAAVAAEVPEPTGVLLMLVCSSFAPWRRRTASTEQPLPQVAGRSIALDPVKSCVPAIYVFRVESPLSRSKLMSHTYFVQSLDALVALLLITAPVHAQTPQLHSVFGVVDQDVGDLAPAVGVIGLYKASNDLVGTGTASFFYDHIFQVAHSAHLSGPNYGLLNDPPDPALASAARFEVKRRDNGQVPTDGVTIEMKGDFYYNPHFFFNPRGSIDGFVYFPEAGGAVDIFFGIGIEGEVLSIAPSGALAALPGTEFLPFYEQRIINVGGVGTLVPFEGTGRVALGRIRGEDVVIQLKATSGGSNPFTLFLPGSLHVNLDPDTIPEPATAALIGLAAALLFDVQRHRRMASRAPSSNRGAVALLLMFSASLLGHAGAATAATINTVPVGNLANANDTTGFGAVSYSYCIGQFEVTNSQYAEFLNAKAASDPLSLFSANMGSDARGGITRTGVSGNFTYATKASMGGKPVNFVNWYDAVRLANWLHNGQGNGDTESGAYTLLSGAPTPSNGTSITRNPGAVWFLPSENEWYKAAYYDPRAAAQGGPPGNDNFWLYPTASDDQPVQAAANGVGEVTNPGPNVANHSAGADWNGLNGNVTTIGSAGPSSASYFGASDQGGNVWEWNDSEPGSIFRRIRGGSWQDGPQFLSAANFQGFLAATSGTSDIGFRVAAEVPEPSTVLPSVIAATILGHIANRRRREASRRG